MVFRPEPFVFAGSTGRPDSPVSASLRRDRAEAAGEGGEFGGWRGTGLTPLSNGLGVCERKSGVKPPPLTHRTLHDAGALFGHPQPERAYRIS